MWDLHSLDVRPAWLVANKGPEVECVGSRGDTRLVLQGLWGDIGFGGLGLRVRDVGTCLHLVSCRSCFWASTGTEHAAGCSIRGPNVRMLHLKFFKGHVSHSLNS